MQVATKEPSRVVLLLWLLLSCTSPRSLPTPAEAPRRPPGIVADPQFSPPNPRPSAPADATVIALQAPSGQGEIAILLDRFFRAVSAESNTELALLMTGNAIAVFPNTTGTSAVGSWNRRFSRADYQLLRVDALYSRDEVATFTARDVLRLRGVHDFHLDPTDDDVLAVVRLRGAPPDLLGASMQFLLTQGADGYRIRATYEEFTPR